LAFGVRRLVAALVQFVQRPVAQPSGIYQSGDKAPHSKGQSPKSKDQPLSNLRRGGSPVLEAIEKPATYQPNSAKGHHQYRKPFSIETIGRDLLSGYMELFTVWE
jgi:hypothetical protein